MDLEPRFLIKRFFEDVLNKITTFAAPKHAQTGPKSLQSPSEVVQHAFQTTCKSRINFWVTQSALARRLRRSTPWLRPDPHPPPPPQGIRPLLAREGKMTMGFCMVQKTSILTPLKLSFSLVFFITVTDAETRPDSRGLRHSADPFGSSTGFARITPS